MNPRYTEVFRAHRLLFLAPVVIAAALAAFSAVTAPKMYQSDSTLWSDSPSSSTAVFGALPPAGQDQQLLDELLTTHYFQMAVARESPLLAYLRTHAESSSGLGMITGKLKGKASLDDRIASSLGATRVTSVAKGPHVLEVSYTAPEPRLASATLQAIITQFRKQRTSLRRDALQAAQQQVGSASDTLARARTNLSSYLTNHPSATRDDPQLQDLARAEREAVDVLSNATDSMNTATQAVAAGQSTQTLLKVIDAPQVPVAPTSGKKKLVVTVAGGAFAGAVIAALGVVLLARRRPRTVVEAVDEPEPLPEDDLESDAMAPAAAGGGRARAARAQGRRLETVD
jgi:uncharacterized protein involved in exopolysaccharide biosynthesis